MVRIERNEARGHGKRKKVEASKDNKVRSVKTKTPHLANRIYCVDSRQRTPKKCFSGGQGSMVINDYFEKLKSVESTFWIHWVLFWSNLLSGVMCFWLYIVKNKLPQYNLPS